MAEWFYAQKEDRLGPISAEKLQELARNGEVLGSTLIWRDGMSDWIALSEMSNEVFTTQTAECAHSGRVFDRSEMLQYGDAWIAPQFKEAYLQKAMESGVPVPGDRDWEQGMQFVGFWWRALAYFVDGLVLMIPNILISIPYMMVSSKVTAADPTNPFAGMTGDATIPYILTTIMTYGLRMGYEVWMVGKFQGTIGKMAIGAKIVTPDGDKVTYGRSFLRALGKLFINTIIIYTIAAIPLAIGFVLNYQEIQSGTMSEEKMAIATVIFGGLALLLLFIGSFPFYMAGFTSQKRALHDMMFGTRVVKKN